MANVKSLLKPKNCSVCGKKLRGVWNSKLIGGAVICRECTSLMRVSSLQIPYLTLSEAEELVARGRKNKENLESFLITKEVESCDYLFRLDEDHSDWYITSTHKTLNPQVYRLCDLKSYRLYENGTLVREKQRGYATVEYDSPEYTEYARLYSYRFLFDIDGLDEPLEIEMVNDNAKDAHPGSRLYNAYLSDAKQWTDFFENILN